MVDRLDEQIAAASWGDLAGQLRKPLFDRIQAREKDILTRAIRDWHGGTLTGDNARAAIASIAELRGLLADVDRDVRNGREARDRFINSPSPQGTARD